LEKEPPLIALVGNPNSGKTTLFNALTGLRQKTGNYPGVTVEWKEGTSFNQHGKPVRLLDLPGSYSLNARSPDERILVEALLGRVPVLRAPDAVICCVDASNLERNLFLVTQVLELGLPTLVVLNMMDVARRRGMQVDVEKLQARLGVPVVVAEASRGVGIAQLRIQMAREWPRGKLLMELPQMVEAGVKDLLPLLGHGDADRRHTREGEARLLLTTDGDWPQAGPLRTKVNLCRQRFDRDIPGWRSELITSRYAWLGETVREVVRKFNPGRRSLTDRADRILLHPVTGFPVLAGVMGLLFYSIFSIAVPFMDGLDAVVGALGAWVGELLPAGQINSLVVDGVIGGVGGVLVFLPQILLLFFFISLLESTGYMARAAFILDRLMSKVGLHGRAFIPLLSSYACAVPGIMATRTIESPKDRLITIMVAPFMTCSARLPVYLVLIAAMLPGDGHGAAVKQALLLLLLYFLGTAMALVFAALFRRTLLKGPSPTLIMELPVYRLPRLSSVLLEMLDRGWIFIKRAGTIIFALSIVLWFLMNYPRVDADAAAALERAAMQHEAGAVLADDGQLEGSFAGQLGRQLEPLFAPLGFDWRITVGVIASFAAREVFVSTMAIIYRVDEEATDSLVETFRAAERGDGTPLFTPLTCLSILMFFVFALQCISTVAIVRRETASWRWPIFQFSYMLAVAWVAAFVVYQGGRLIGFS
jgi:ferrous iron transport protein B